MRGTPEKLFTHQPVSYETNSIRSTKYIVRIGGVRAWAHAAVTIADCATHPPPPHDRCSATARTKDIAESPSLPRYRERRGMCTAASRSGLEGQKRFKPARAVLLSTVTPSRTSLRQRRKNMTNQIGTDPVRIPNHTRIHRKGSTGGCAVVDSRHAGAVHPAARATCRCSTLSRHATRRSCPCTTHTSIPIPECPGVVVATPPRTSLHASVHAFLLASTHAWMRAAHASTLEGSGLRRQSDIDVCARRYSAHTTGPRHMVTLTPIRSFDKGRHFDLDTRGVVPNLRGQVISYATGEPLEGLYVVGWAKRGASGGVGDNRTCAAETVTQLAANFRLRV